MIKKILNFKFYNKLISWLVDLKFKNVFQSRKNTAGFSMIELLVTIAILMVVSGTVFFNHSQFNNNVLIENLAYEISLAIRQAQSYGVQVKEINSSFDKGYGVYFSDDSEVFLIFADINKNFLYDLGIDLVVDNLKMMDGNTISDLCVTLNGAETCGESSVSIGFLRPDPDAKIYTNINGPYDSVDIKITSPKEVKKKISVNSVGQISVHSI